jgi:hypothetical protein
MKIYFTAAIFQKKDYGQIYSRIVNHLKNKGYLVEDKHILTVKLEQVLSETDEQKIKYYKRFLRSVNECDIVVAEASFPSTVNVGHEISVALEKGKPVVVLYAQNQSPVFLEGIQSERLLVQEYTNENLEVVIDSSIAYLSSQQDTRFNFFISPQIGNYLDWVSKKKRLPRAVYLRRLIELDMKRNIS